MENQKQLFHIIYQIWQIDRKKVHAISRRSLRDNADTWKIFPMGCRPSIDNVIR